MTYLLCARDIGAGRGILALACHLDRMGMPVDLHLQVPMADHPDVAGWFKRVALPSFTTASAPAAFELLDYAAAALRDIQPVAVIVGGSGPDAGIDEAFVRAAKGLFPVFVFQDAPGDFNCCLGVLPDHYLVMDDFAAHLTLERTGVPSTVVGALQYENYVALDPVALRRSWRARHGLNAEERTVSLFGQPLWDWHGWTDNLRITFTALAEVSRTKGNLVIFYRPHPKELGARTDVISDLAVSAGIEIRFDLDTHGSAAVSAADLLLTAFSTASYDLAMLTRMSEGALGVALHVMAVPELLGRFQAESGLDAPSVVTLGLTDLAVDPARVTEFVGRCLDVNAAEAYQTRVCNALVLPGEAAVRTMECVQSMIQSGYGT